MFYPHSPFTKYPDVQSQIFNHNGNSVNSVTQEAVTNKYCQWLSTSPKCTTYRVNLLKADTDTIKSKIEDALSKKYSILPAIHSIPEIPELLSISQLPSTEESVVRSNNNIKEIIVDPCCGASILRGAHVYAPGVMAMQSGTKIGEDVNIYADIEGKCKRGTNVVYKSATKTFLGIGTVKMIRYQLFSEETQPRGIAVEMISVISGVPSIGDLTSPEFMLQNFPSIICSRVLDPKPGETILDMCAAPGNKSTHILELMNDSGVLICLDKTESKIELVKRKIQERNLMSASCFAFDSTKALSDCLTETNLLHGPPFAQESFDRILLDAPCSALGNRPVLRCDLTLKMMQSFPKVQRKLFAAAVGLLKKGGFLVYSTCTITTSENESMVRWAIDTFKELQLVKSEPIFGGIGLEHSQLSDHERHSVQRFGPEDTNSKFDSVGFFIAKFKKKEAH